MNVPLLDLKAQFATIREEVLAAVTEVLDSQVCIGGPKVTELEQKIAAISDCKYAVGVSSGTDALLCSLMALGVGPGDEVITTPFTFFATAGSIARTGATPVFVDIDPRTYNLNPELLTGAVTARTKAIIPVHLFGHHGVLRRQHHAIRTDRGGSERRRSIYAFSRMWSHGGSSDQSVRRTALRYYVEKRRLLGRQQGPYIGCRRGRLHRIAAGRTASAKWPPRAGAG